MSVNRRVLLSIAASVYLFAVPIVAWAVDDNFVALDTYVFRQQDGGGNPYQGEGLSYVSGGFDLRVATSDNTAIRANAVVAYLHNDPVPALPGTITNADLTTASPDFTTLDTSISLDITFGGGTWVFSPSLFYHHQLGYLAGGGDLGLKHFAAGGDTVLAFNYSGRIGKWSQARWDGEPFEVDFRATHNLLLTWTQHLSADWILMAGFQYTHESGLLHSTLQYVVLFDEALIPRLLIDENLPRERNRFQFNLRSKYSPRVGTSIGLDASVYADDWDILHGAWEPNFETPIGYRMRLQLWYRLSIQQQTKYFSAMPKTVPAHVTQDSDLASFVMHSPGAGIVAPLAVLSLPRWYGRFALYGFYRDDGIFTVGSTMGFMTRW